MPLVLPATNPNICEMTSMILPSGAQPPVYPSHRYDLPPLPFSTDLKVFLYVCIFIFLLFSPIEVSWTVWVCFWLIHRRYIRRLLLVQVIDGVAWRGSPMYIFFPLRLQYTVLLDIRLLICPLTIGVSPTGLRVLWLTSLAQLWLWRNDLIMWRVWTPSRNDG